METIDLSKKAIVEIQTNFRDREPIKDFISIEFGEDLELCINVRQAAALENILRRFQEAFYAANALAATRTVDST